jgi:hypothetical protein
VQPRHSQRGHAARAQWGGVLNALLHPIQIVVRGTPASTMPMLDRIKRHGSPQAKGTGSVAGRHLHGAQLVDLIATWSCRPTTR